MKERDFCRQMVTPWLKEKGIYYFKPRGGPYSTRMGIADYILCISGRLIALEIKSEKGKQTAHQLNEQRAINEAGGVYFLVKPSNWKDVQQKLLGAV